MRVFVVFLGLLGLLVSTFGPGAVDANTEVIVFVHGLLGFGRNELLGLGYWGFPLIYGQGNNLTAWMQQQTGLTTYEASVGPISSNWDRACELYAQILGRVTDFGRAHATEFVHNRMGRDYTLQTGSYNYYRQGGFFTSWSSTNRIHFVTHSMGGQTIRFLERLLHYGDQTEMALQASGGYNNDPDGPMSDLFNTANNRDWIASISTIASPLDGSTLHTKLDSTGVPITNYLKNILFIIAQASSELSWFNSADVNGPIYDFDLEQHPGFGLPASMTTYAEFQNWTASIFDNPIWSEGYLDLADYDMSPHKMMLFNGAGPRVFNNTRYFAMQTWATSVCLLDWSDQCADLTVMEPLMAPTSDIMGDLQYSNGTEICDAWGYTYSASWEANDGLSPQISSNGPKWGQATSGPNSTGAPIPHPTDIFGNYLYSTSVLEKAQWYYIPVNCDHVQAIGLEATSLPWFMYKHIANCINAIKYTI